MLLFKRLIKVGLIFIFLACLSLAALYLSMRSELPSVTSLKDMQWQTPMQIFSADNKLINQFGEKKRIPLKLNEFPQQLINAILASEDDRFYSHFGVDPIGLGRAVLGKLMGQNKGGASTITMQVARNFFLSSEVTYTRKIREIFLTFHIESLLTKDEILALYMNKIPLSHRSFGFGAAAQVYYGKDVKDLTLAQIAVLAGLPKAPSNRNPISSPDNAKTNRAIVLQRMYSAGYINSTEMEQANQAPITGKRHSVEIELNAPYIAEMAHQEMVDLYGKELAYTGGYNVYLTVNSDFQRAAQKAVIDNLLSYDLRHGYRGAVVSLRPELTENTSTIDKVAELSDDEVIKALNKIDNYQTLFPAVITGIAEQSATIKFLGHQDNNHITLQEGDILWQGMSWAREFINDEKQGAAPKLANEILQYGDVVFVIKTAQGFTLSQLPEVSSALVSLSTDNGAIKAAIGGFSFQQSQFNRVTQAKRQVGSNIKPFIYSAALDNGFTLATLVNDAPINQWDESSGSVWRPENSPPIYNGDIRVRLALAQSKNVIAVRLLRAVGLDKIIPHLAAFGFVPNDLPRNETLALGSASLTPLEVATGFATFANGGYLIRPYLIDRIEDSFGKVLFQANPAIACDICSLEIKQRDINNSSVPFELLAEKDVRPLIKAERVISPQNAFLVTQALNAAIWGSDYQMKPFWRGTGWRAQTLKRHDIAGKTGTTNQSKDAWFSGFSRRLVTTSWVGFDDPGRSLGKTRYNSNLDKYQITGGEAGAKSAQPAWIDFMEVALVAHPEEAFIQPVDIVSVRIDKSSGKLTNKTDKTSFFEYFQFGTAPTESVTQDNSSEILDGSRIFDESSNGDIF
ncbi:penicillin-binding protein 1A [Colwellia sp. BRX10-6]|uniref:penicillin-binding protein 1A n=1 Tax=unclassified Colwellia TaxID=196834 RepID=UPI0015F61C78|nr:MULTISPECIES: penicillin-binding protein 1A [unclassified Colwellia]MBA6382088.1 penicillin-binding protein 1A [Colwellia sp. BRX10-9]MBA6392459.1 penicillin-binding protein 1A [Colwellia sp. BRX10-6]